MSHTGNKGSLVHMYFRNDLGVHLLGACALNRANTVISRHLF